MPVHTAAIESLREFAETAGEAARSGIASYRRIFREERVVRACDLLAFALIHVYVFVPLVCYWLEFKLPNYLPATIVGSVWAVIGYPFAYLEDEKAGLLKISVGEYLKSRGIALVGAWYLLVFVPIFTLYALRWLVIPLIGLRLLYAYLAS